MPRPILTLEQLATVEERTRMFSPYGLGGLISAADSVRYIQDLVKDAELTPRAPADVRAAFDVAVKLHIHGVFAYVLFTMATVQTRLIRELALGLRFIEVYEGRIPLERRFKGTVVATDTVECSEFRLVVWRIGRRGSHPYEKGWRLVGHEDFTGGLSSLCRWARRAGPLRPWLDELWTHGSPGAWQALLADIPQRPPMPDRPERFMEWSAEEQRRWFEEELRPAWELVRIGIDVEMRNIAAHPTIQPVDTPVQSSIEIEGLARFVNLLWP